mmetsp:Transcript_21289/g.64041  ORF Transcript_21289/g.64041 Transcript_21289/m.64041 type:complete len:315 (+) Transcript_21289:3529-4473(+)
MVHQALSAAQRRAHQPRSAAEMGNSRAYQTPAATPRSDNPPPIPQPPGFPPFSSVFYPPEPHQVAALCPPPMAAQTRTGVRDQSTVRDTLKVKNQSMVRDQSTVKFQSAAKDQSVVRDQSVVPSTPRHAAVMAVLMTARSGGRSHSSQTCTAPYPVPCTGTGAVPSRPACSPSIDGQHPAMTQTDSRRPLAMMQADSRRRGPGCRALEDSTKGPASQRSNLCSSGAVAATTRLVTMWPPKEAAAAVATAPAASTAAVAAVPAARTEPSAKIPRALHAEAAMELPGPLAEGMMAPPPPLPMPPPPAEEVAGGLAA